MAGKLKFERAAAVEAAMERFWTDGYEANSVQSLAKHLGITRSSFYNAFGTREDLFREALRHYASNSPDLALRDAPCDMPVRRLFTQLFREICRLRAADPEARGCLAINSLCELAGGPGAASTPEAELGGEIASFVQANIGQLEQILKRAVAQGELPDSYDTHGAALSLQALMIGVNTLAKAVRSEAELLRSAETSLRGLDLWEDPSNA